MKHKILSIMVIGVLITVFSCNLKSTKKDQGASVADSTVVKSDSTLTTELPQDSLQSK